MLLDDLADESLDLVGLGDVGLDADDLGLIALLLDAVGHRLEVLVDNVGGIDRLGARRREAANGSGANAGASACCQLRVEAGDPPVMTPTVPASRADLTRGIGCMLSVMSWK